MKEPDTLWTVDPFMDSVHERKRKDAERLLYGQAVYPRKFLTQQEAYKFIVARAERNLMEAKHALRLAKKNLLKCQKKFSVPA